MGNIKGFFSEVDGFAKIIAPIASKANCLKCGLDKRCKTPRMPMAGEGRKEIFVLGEGPVADEDLQGRPFVGDSGQLLATVLGKLGINLYRDCWIMNSINCRPPANRTPSPKEMSCCRPMVEQALAQTKPKIILLFGTKALQSHFKGQYAHKRLTVSNWTRHCVPDYRYNAWVLPQFHPAALLHNKNGILDEVFHKDLAWALMMGDKKLPKFDKPEVRLLLNTEEVINALEKINRDSEYFFFDFETSGLKPYTSGHKVYTIAACDESCNVFAFPYHYPHFTDNQLKRIGKAFGQVLLNKEINKVAHNLKFEKKWSKYILDTDPVSFFWCTMTAQHCIDTRRSQSRLDFQAFSRYGQPEYDSHINPFKVNVNGEFNTMFKVPLKELLQYNGIDVFYTRKLFFDQQKFFEKNPDVRRFYKNIFHKGLLSLSQSEDIGIPINVKYYKKTREELEDKLKQQEDDLMNKGAGLKFKKKFGRTVDIQSPKDLRALFYDVLELKSKKETKTGLESVDEYALTNITEPFAKNLLAFRKNKKRYDYVNEYYTSNHEGRLHPSIDLNHAASGRSNSSNPNLHNIPVRDEESARLIRGGIIPSKGNMILECDYKAIEVRVMACYTHDPMLISYILDAKSDMHRDQAMKIFKLPAKEVTKQIRHIGKNDFVFPEFYGDWYEMCAKAAWEDCNGLKTTSGVLLRDHLEDKRLTTLKGFMRHMQQVEEDFWDMLKVTKRWRKKVVNDYLDKGYVDTFFGFRRTGYLERNQIINTPVQGTAFHCLLWCYNRLTFLFKEMLLKSSIIGQIHDSILVDLVPKEKDVVCNLMREVMEKELTNKYRDWLIVPMEVEIECTEIDKSWNTKKELKK